MGCDFQPMKLKLTNSENQRNIESGRDTKIDSSMKICYRWSPRDLSHDQEDETVPFRTRSRCCTFSLAMLELDVGVWG